MDVWVGDGAGGTGTDGCPARTDQHRASRVVGRSAPVRCGHRRPARHPARDAGRGACPEEVVLDAAHAGAPRATAARSCSSRLSTDSLSLWTADASGRRIAQLAPGLTARPGRVTPDDRSVLYSSVVGGTVSIWTVPFDGGTPTKLVDGASVSVSPDGGSIAFTDTGIGSSVHLVVCALPGCASPRPIGPAPFDAPVRVDARWARRRLSRATGISGCSRSPAASLASSRVHRDDDDGSCLLRGALFTRLVPFAGATSPAREPLPPRASSARGSSPRQRPRDAPSAGPSGTAARLP